MNPTQEDLRYAYNFLAYAKKNESAMWLNCSWYYWEVIMCMVALLMWTDGCDNVKIQSLTQRRSDMYLTQCHCNNKATSVWFLSVAISNGESWR